MQINSHNFLLTTFYVPVTVVYLLNQIARSFFTRFQTTAYAYGTEEKSLSTHYQSFRLSSSIFGFFREFSTDDATIGEYTISQSSDNDNEYYIDGLLMD